MQVSLVHASPKKPNTGMAMVDRGWESFVRRNDLSLDVEKYRFDVVCHDGGHSSGYRCLTDDLEEALSAERIIYWGDFAHMPHYQRQVAAQLVASGAAKSFDEAYRLTKATFLLSDSKDCVRERVVSFGTNLLQVGPAQFVEEPYHSHLVRLVKQAKAWLPRDSYSADLGRLIRNGHLATQGVDCALMAWNRLFCDSPRDTRSRSGVGIFFGRSDDHTLGMLRLAKSLGRRTDEPLQWIPWISQSNKRKRIRQETMRILSSRNAILHNPDEQPTWLSQLSFVVTDTYHLAVNSWAAGTPAVCVGSTNATGARWWNRTAHEGASLHHPTSINSGAEFAWRDKRYFFYLMNDALDFFVHMDELNYIKARRRRADHILRCLNNNRLLDWIDRRVRSTARRAESYLLDSLSG